ncbi:hypothetical protein C0995_005937 [Termitomyces sp. Mi166|nr:hypothetical protein C0995_005937 [Termitomyces sp. Mi166\
MQSLLKLISKDNIAAIDIKVACAMGDIFNEAYLWDKAEPLLRQVVRTHAQALGTNHLDTIQVMGHLAATLRRAGKLEEAEDIEQQVLKAQIKAFESRHPDTIQVMSNLATTLWSAGKLEKAEDLYQQLLKAQTEALGSRNPDTIQTMANHAGDTMVDTVADGSLTTRTVKVMANLAATLRNVGRLKEAKDFEQQVLKAQIEAFKSKHPDTIWAMINLAATLKKAGRLKEAEDLEQQVIMNQSHFDSSHF